MEDPRKAIFDAVRAAAPAGLFADAGNVLALDNLLDAFDVPRAAASAPTPPVAQSSAFGEAIIAHLRREEGVRARAYKDHLGYWTIGVGRLIDQRKGGRITADEDAVLIANDPARRGKDWTAYVLSDPEIDMLLKNDVTRFVSVICDWPAWLACDGNVARQVALTSMAFQMGTAGLSGFKNTLAMIASGDFASAADNMLKSVWAKQTPTRARRVAQMIRLGVL